MLLVSVMVAFLVSRATTMAKFVDADVVEDILPFFFNEEFQFGSDTTPEFTLAFGLSRYYEWDFNDFDDYGEFRAHFEWWNPKEVHEVPIESRPCTLKDFGLDLNDPNENQRFSM